MILTFTTAGGVTGIRPLAALGDTMGSATASMDWRLKKHGKSSGKPSP